MKVNSLVPTVEEFRLATAWIVMATYSPITTMDFATIESCSIRMLRMGIVTTITRFCGLICKFIELSRVVIDYCMREAAHFSLITFFYELILCVFFIYALPSVSVQSCGSSPPVSLLHVE